MVVCRGVRCNSLEDTDIHFIPKYISVKSLKMEHFHFLICLALCYSY